MSAFAYKFTDETEVLEETIEEDKTYEVSECKMNFRDYDDENI